MAQARALTPAVREVPANAGGVAAIRVVTIAALLAGWEALSRSGWLYRDVVPGLDAIGTAMFTLLSDSATYAHLGVTVFEIAIATVIGGALGLAVGLVLGANRFLARAYEPFLYYLGPTPKIIFFPLMILAFGVGPGSKIAMGAISCFFPVALSIAAGMREVNATLIKVGRSFRASSWQMVTKIYLPALRYPAVNGLRLGLGIAVIGTLLAETKLSNQGLGFLVINAYSTFNMPRMYAGLIVLFLMSIVANTLVGRLAGEPGRGRA